MRDPQHEPDLVQRQDRQVGARNEHHRADEPRSCARTTGSGRRRRLPEEREPRGERRSLLAERPRERLGDLVDGEAPARRDLNHAVGEDVRDARLLGHRDDRDAARDAARSLSLSGGPTQTSADASRGRRRSRRRPRGRPLRGARARARARASGAPATTSGRRSPAPMRSSRSTPRSASGRSRALTRGA